MVDSQVEWRGAATPTIANDSRNTASQHCVGEGSSRCITEFDDDNEDCLCEYVVQNICMREESELARAQIVHIGEIVQSLVYNNRHQESISSIEHEHRAVDRTVH